MDRHKSLSNGSLCPSLLYPVHVAQFPIITFAHTKLMLGKQAGTVIRPKTSSYKSDESLCLYNSLQHMYLLSELCQHVSNMSSTDSVSILNELEKTCTMQMDQNKRKP